MKPLTLPLTQSPFFILVILVIGIFLGSLFTKSKKVDAPKMDHSMDSMTQEMDAMKETLNATADKEFDKAFLREMITHHAGAVSMAQSVLNRTKKAELKEFATEIIEAQSKEIKKMQAWEKDWFSK
jgi:uncharacterized protein (DUF305 family)